eukprot:366048-Chlamydomonas_euryale.AAC.8
MPPGLSAIVRSGRPVLTASAFACSTSSSPRRCSSAQCGDLTSGCVVWEGGRASGEGSVSRQYRDECAQAVEHHTRGARLDCRAGLCLPQHPCITDWSMQPAGARQH